MTNQLNEKQTTILKAICFKDPEQNKHLYDAFNGETLTFNEIEQLCSIINDEFMMEGILPTYEPNEYGLELEKLLDVVNRLRTHL